MAANLLIAGAGGHGRVVADAASESGGWTRIAFLDDGYPALARSGAWDVVGVFADLAALSGEFDACVPAVGDPALRLSVVDRARAAGFQTPAIVHPRACVSAHARLGAGTVVAAGAIVNIGASLGEACIVNTGATVDHDCQLGAGVHVCPGAHLAGNVTMGARTWFGIGAVAKQGIRIGADVIVGAGAACVRDIEKGVVVVGVPARERGT